MSIRNVQWQYCLTLWRSWSHSSSLSILIQKKKRKWLWFQLRHTIVRRMVYLKYFKQCLQHSVTLSTCKQETERLKICIKFMEAGNIEFLDRFSLFSNLKLFVWKKWDHLSSPCCERGSLHSFVCFTIVRWTLYYRCIILIFINAYQVKKNNNW